MLGKFLAPQHRSSRIPLCLKRARPSRRRVSFANARFALRARDVEPILKHPEQPFGVRNIMRISVAAGRWLAPMAERQDEVQVWRPELDQMPVGDEWRVLQVDRAEDATVYPPVVRLIESPGRFRDFGVTSATVCLPKLAHWV